MQLSTMKLTKLFIVFIVALFSLNNIAAQNVIPRANPPVLVTDLAGVLSPEEKQALENKLVAVDDASSNQIAVVILPTLDGNPIEEYALKLAASTWPQGIKPVVHYSESKALHESDSKIKPQAHTIMIKP